MSLGEHIFDGVWAQVLLYDKFNGIDFIQDSGTIISTKMHTIDESNVRKMSVLLAADNFKTLDIKAASKCHTANLKNYRFDILNLANRIY